MDIVVPMGYRRMDPWKKAERLKMRGAALHHPCMDAAFFMKKVGANQKMEFGDIWFPDGQLMIPGKPIAEYRCAACKRPLGLKGTPRSGDWHVITLLSEDDMEYLARLYPDQVLNKEWVKRHPEEIKNYWRNNEN